jgi:hypothetical protein
LSLARLSVHRFELVLKRLVEQLVPMLAQEDEKLPALPRQLQQALLPCALLHSRLPAFHAPPPKVAT